MNQYQIKFLLVSSSCQVFSALSNASCCGSVQCCQSSRAGIWRVMWRVGQIFFCTAVWVRAFDTFSSMYDFAVSWPWGSLGCGCELDLNSLIPYETTGISGSLPPACNETFGKNKGDVNTKDTKTQKFCVFTQMMSVLFKMACFLVLRKWLLFFHTVGVVSVSRMLCELARVEWFLRLFPL